MKTISLTIPLEEEPLRRASDMLTGLLSDLEKERLGREPLGAPHKPTAALTPKEECGDTFTEGEIAEGDAQIVADEAVIPAAPTVDPAQVFGAIAETVIPTPPAETAASATLTVEFDSEGIPWDARIHTGAKTRRQGDNTWKLKRGTALTLVDQVKAELLANMSAPAPAVTEAPPAPAVETTEPPAEVIVTTFPELVTYVTAKCNAGVVQQHQIAELVSKHGITGGLPAVASRPDLIPAIYADMVALWLTTQG